MQNPLNLIGIRYNSGPRWSSSVRKRLGIRSVSVDDRDAQKIKSYASLSFNINNLEFVSQ
jgi:hypothetical protein